MLASIKIKNISIIDNIEIDFEKGLNIITGETGAGKSIFLNSILLLTGKKLSPNEVLRAGANSGAVEAIIWHNEDDIVIRREIVKDGRGKVYINGKFASLNELKEITKGFIEFSAQNQNQILFNKYEQLKFLDTFGKLENYLEDYKKSFITYKSAEKKLKELQKKEKDIEFKKKNLIEDLEVLEKASLNDIHEEEQLKQHIEFAENYEKIKHTLNFAFYELFDNENSTIKKISDIKESFFSISTLKDSFKDIANMISEIEINLEEVEKLILSELGNFDDQDLSIDSLYERQNIINKLKKRFQKNNIVELIELRDRLKNEIESMENIFFDIKNAQKDVEKFYNILKKNGKILSLKRHEVAKKFEKEVRKHLNDLKMTKVDFKVSLTSIDDFMENGIDEVEFLISTNIGEPLKPLEKVVSGGELSRIMLALKTVLSDYLKIPVLIFDEVDSGTGGEVAFAIGKKLKEISKKHQVFVITHIPQVAAFSEHHYKIEKVFKDNKAISIIKKLNLNEKINEIARMISADNITENAIENAKELIESGRIYEAKTG